MMTSSNGNIFSVTGPLCGEFTGEFPAHRPVTRSFDVFFDMCLNTRLSKQSWGWWFETQSRQLWRHCNVLNIKFCQWRGKPNLNSVLKIHVLNCIKWIFFAEFIRNTKQHVRFQIRITYCAGLTRFLSDEAFPHAYNYWCCINKLERRLMHNFGYTGSYSYALLNIYRISLYQEPHFYYMTLLLNCNNTNQMSTAHQNRLLHATPLSLIHLKKVSNATTTSVWPLREYTQWRLTLICPLGTIHIVT